MEIYHTKKCGWLGTFCAQEPLEIGYFGLMLSHILKGGTVHMSQKNASQESKIITDVPSVQVEFTSESLAQIYFEPTLLNPTLSLYEGPLDELHVMTAGAVIVKTENILAGWLTVCLNPARSGHETLRAAANTVVNLLGRVNYPNREFKGINAK